METDDLTKHVVNIAGYSTPANLLTDPTLVPQPNEALLDGATGTFYFNAADAGKAITGTYTYLAGDAPRTVAPVQVDNAYGCVLKLRADNGPNASTVGQPVTLWTDQSGVNNNGTATSTNAPTISSVQKNGLPVVNFSGVFAVKFNSLNSGQQLFIAEAVNQAGNYGLSGIGLSSNGSGLNFAYKSQGDNYTSFNTAQGLLVTNAWYIIGFIFDASQGCVITINGTVIATGNTNNTNAWYWKQPTVCTIGAYKNAPDSGLYSPLNADVAWIDIFQVPLSPQALLSVNNAINSVYAIY
jgi:hypothetical protein